MSTTPRTPRQYKTDTLKTRPQDADMPRPGNRSLWRIWWTTIVIVSAVIMALIPIATVWIFARPLLLLLIAMVIAQALAPLADRLHRWMPRVVAVLLLYLVLSLTLGIIVWLAFTPLVIQAQQFSSRLPEMVDLAQNWVQRHEQLSGAMPSVENLISPLESISVHVISVPVAAAALIIDLLIIVVLSIYWIISMSKLEYFTLSFFPRRYRSQAREVIHQMGQTMGGYVRGVGITMFLVGLFTYVGLEIIGVEFPLILALIAGLLEAIPIVGPIIAGFIIVGVTMLDSFQLGLFVAIYFFIIEQIEGHILVPNVMRSQTDIPAPLVVIALLAGASIGGLLGAIVAIPIAGALRVFFLRVITPAIRHWAGAEPLEEGELDEPPEFEPATIQEVPTNSPKGENL
jgi:predicted PurR-regulated permease PerM